jgi:hypothetical protein
LGTIKHSVVKGAVSGVNVRGFVKLGKKSDSEYGCGQFDPQTTGPSGAEFAAARG